MGGTTTSTVDVTVTTNSTVMLVKFPSTSYWHRLVLLVYYNNKVWCPLKFTRVGMNILIYFVVKTFKIYLCMSILIYWYEIFI